MKKIFKILSIFVMVFVLFSCANPSSDSTSGSQPSGSETPVETPSDDTEPSGPETPVETPSDDTEPSGPETPVETPTDDTEPSGPETPVETPSDDPVEETPEEPTYSITFVAASDSEGPIANELNNNWDFKNIKENLEVIFPECIYMEEWNCQVEVWYYYEGTTGYNSTNKIKSTVMDSNKKIIVVIP